MKKNIIFGFLCIVVLAAKGSPEEPQKADNKNDDLEQINLVEEKEFMPPFKVKFRRKVNGKRRWFDDDDKNQ